MSKILGSWSGMRKYLEQEMLAESIKGRVQYSCTSYPNMDECKVFEIRADGKTVKRFSMESEAWKKYWHEKSTVSVENRTEFDDEDFCDALRIYRENPIEESINHINPIVRMFAVLDRRIGKRTLVKLAETSDNQPEWLKEIYLLRINAEK